ncbi:MAG: hypothetical protein AAGI92_08930 [Pseudomonadota bacterium]
MKLNGLKIQVWKLRASLFVKCAAIFAFLAIAFAHDPLAADPWEVALDKAQFAAQYALPDGTVPDRCSDLHGNHQDHLMFACEHCLVSGAIALGSVSTVPNTLTLSARTVAPRYELLLSSRPLALKGLTRAPPALA